MDIDSKLLDCLYSALYDCKPERLLRKFVKRKGDFLSIKNKKYNIFENKIYIIGFGKASAGMAFELEKIIGADNIVSGLVVTTPTKIITKKIKLLESSHPTLTSKSFLAGARLLNFANKIPNDSLVICLNSGGGSALVASPHINLTVKEKKDFFKFLLLQGLNEIDQNIVRKSISSIKGGELGKVINQKDSMLVNLVIMDNPFDYKALSSGPTFIPDYKKSAKKILEEEGLYSKVPLQIKNIMDSEENNTYNYKKSLFQDVVLGGPITAKESLAKYANKNFDNVFVIDESYYDKNINDVVEHFISFCDKIVRKKSDNGTCAIIANGEIPVSLPSNPGRGGRNQHFAALFLKKAASFSWRNFSFASFATDGRDFMKNIHGAIITNKTVDLMNKLGIEPDYYINRFDTFSMHNKLNTLLKGELSGTNCSDLYFYAHSN